jgi:hypothetical protein
MRALLVLGLVAVACFREAPPCDQASLDRIVSTCPSEAECMRLLDERRELCAARFRRGE